MVTRVFEICNAYESGYGHGYQRDGRDGEYYSDPDFNQAYRIGYKAGIEQRDIESTPRPLKCNHCGYEQLTCFHCDKKNSMHRV